MVKDKPPNIVLKRSDREAQILKRYNEFPSIYFYSTIDLVARLAPGFIWISYKT